MNLIHKINKIIKKEKLIEVGDRVLIGVSGGIDSTTLLYALFEISKQINFKLAIAHLNHQLRGEESERDEQFVEGIARKLSLPFHIKKVNVKVCAEKRGISIQHAGRDLRYNFFEEIANRYNFNKIAVAHNLDDQVETFFLRMLKGTGIRGLSSIPITRDKIIRPFIDIYRFEIEGYARKNMIEHVEDSSNEKIVYERNYIRKLIIPLMSNINPLFKDKINSLFHDITTINNLYDIKTDNFLKKEEKKVMGDICFEIDALKEIDEETRFRVMARVFAVFKSDFIPLREHIRLIDKILSSKKPNLMLIMPSGIRIKKIYNMLVFTNKPVSPKITDRFPIKIGKNSLEPLRLTLDVSLLLKDINLQCPPDRYIACLNGDMIGDLSVRTFLEGDRFFPLGMINQIKLKDFFISQKIPKEERSHVPLLISDNDIVWIIGHRIDERYKITDNTQRILKIVAKNMCHEE